MRKSEKEKRMKVCVRAPLFGYWNSQARVTYPPRGRISAGAQYRIGNEETKSLLSRTMQV